MSRAPTGDQIVAEILSEPPRPTGSDAERRVANRLAVGLRSEGRSVGLEPIYVQPQWATVQMLHCLLAVAGSLLAPALPAVGFALVVAVGLSLYLDLNGRAYLVRRLLFRRASQNIVSPPIGEEPEDRALICAHYDAPRTGAVYSPAAQRAWATFERLWPVRTSPQAIIFWSIALLVPVIGVRLAGVDGDWVGLLQLPQTVVLVVAAFLLGEVALSPPSPGANDNASGVAAALLAGRDLALDPPQRLTVHVLLLGAGESGRQGFHEFMRTHRRELPPKRTWFIDLDSVGRGDPRFVLREIPALARPLDPTLIGLAEALAEGGERLGPLDPGPAGTASAAAGRRYPAIALTARDGDLTYPPDHHSAADLPDELREASITAVAGVAAGLVRLLDRELGRLRPGEESGPA